MKNRSTLVPSNDNGFVMAQQMKILQIILFLVVDKIFAFIFILTLRRNFLWNLKRIVED